MHITKTISEIKSSRPVVTIGFFDGVHKGHVSILDTLVQGANSKNYESLIITFWPHPRIVLGNDPQSLKLLTSLDEKLHLFEEKGVNEVLLVDFTKEFAEQSAVDFIHNILISRIKPSVVVLGYNHTFGKGGTGNLGLLRQHEAKGGYQTIKVEPYAFDGINVSSTKIRAALATGRLNIANAMLGYPYLLSGTIEGGRQIGRSIGYPTANIKPVEPFKQIPADGVYAVWIDYQKNSYPAMLNIGVKPTIGNGLLRTIEAHIIGFEKNIYDQQITVRFIERIRDEQHFSSLDELKHQLAIDKEKTVTILGC